MMPDDIFRQLFWKKSKKIDDVLITNCIFQPTIDNMLLKMLWRHCITQYYAFNIEFAGKSFETCQNIIQNHLKLPMSLKSIVIDNNQKHFVCWFFWGTMTNVSNQFW